MAETLLTVEHLIKKYGDQVILDDVSLDVKKGEVIVVVGPSGWAAWSNGEVRSSTRKANL